MLLLFFLLLLSCNFFGNSQCQRLSTGASNWYMRFQNNVKRSIDDASIVEYHVTSVIRHRYAITEIKVLVHNPANIRQIYRFGHILPKTALVSNVKLFRGNHEEWSASPESNWKRIKSGGNGNGVSFDHKDLSHQYNPYSLHQDMGYELDFDDFQQFVLPIHIYPQENITISLVYEDLLYRHFDKYVHSISISPGNIVSKFQIKVSIEESRPLIGLSFNVPIIGDVTLSNQSHIDFNLSSIEQFDIFGNHGFAGIFRAEYDVLTRPNTSPDVIVMGNYFVHFYEHPTVELKSIPKHVIILLDTSESMNGPKWDHAIIALDILLQNLDDEDFINVILFNTTSEEWNPYFQETYSCSKNYSNEVIDFIRNVLPSGSSDLAHALVTAIHLDKKLWISNALPENAQTMMLVLTDGRSASNHSAGRKISNAIRKANQLSRIPILILGMGFDANMDFLENIAERSNGYAENIIEDLDVDPQLGKIKKYLNDVILKNLRLDYIGSDVFDHVTQTQFKYFHRHGSVVTAGKLKSKREFEVEITGQSADGLYMENPPVIPLSSQYCKDGTLILCSDVAFHADCVELNMSRANLRQYGFGNRAVSVNITGNCYWTLYSEAYYNGRNLTLGPGEYERIEMYKDVSSVRILFVPDKESDFKDETQTSVSRLWAYLMIHQILGRLQDRAFGTSYHEIFRYSSLAYQYHFMTPFTDLRLEKVKDVFSSSFSNELLTNDLLTYKDLTPVLSSHDDPSIASQWQTLENCNPPIKCRGNFHYEELNEGIFSSNESECSGTLTLFTKTNFEGESIELSVSIFQLYHKFSSQRFRSLISAGNCCWLLFNKRFFAGNVDRICGSDSRLFRMKNIASIKSIGLHYSIIK